MTTATNDPDASGDAAAGVDDDRAAGAHLARNLTGLRHARGLTQEALARGAALPRSTIANLESGAGNPSLANLARAHLAAASFRCGNLADDLPIPPSLFNPHEGAIE